MPDVRHTRRPGRPRVSENPEARERHIQCAMMRLATFATVEETAAAFDISERTVHNWTALALTYQDHRSNFLRRLSGRDC